MSPEKTLPSRSFNTTQPPPDHFATEMFPGTRDSRTGKQSPGGGYRLRLFPDALPCPGPQAPRLGRRNQQRAVDLHPVVIRKDKIRALPVSMNARIMVPSRKFRIQEDNAGLFDCLGDRGPPGTIQGNHLLLVRKGINNLHANPVRTHTRCTDHPPVCRIHSPWNWLSC